MRTIPSKHKYPQEYVVELPNVPIELRSPVEEEIRKLAVGVEAAADRLGVPFLLQRIRLTDRFHDDVSHLLCDRQSCAGYVAHRETVQAVGKTIWERSPEGDIGFSVVINTNAIGCWSPKNAHCLITLLHELCHVIYEAQHIERLGLEEYTAIEDTKERLLDRWATSILDEFDVDRDVDKIIQTIVSKGNGQPLSLRELDESQGIDWANGLFGGLEKLPLFLDENIWKFRFRQVGIDELAATVIPTL